MKKTMTRMMVVAVVVLVMMGMAEGWRRKKWRGRGGRGCRRAAGQGVMEEGAGDRFRWTMSGLDEDDLRVTYHEGAFAPEGETVIFKYPYDRGQRVLGLVPAKLVYDFSVQGAPVTAIRKAQRGRGMCIVLRSDVTGYDEMKTQLLERNGTNREVMGADTAERWVVEESNDDSQFSVALRRICSQDLCGNPINTVYYNARPERLTVPEEEVELQGPDDDDAMFDRSFILFNSRVVISGLPHPRHRRRHMRRMESPEERQQRRQQRRLQRRQNRRNRRQRSQVVLQD